MTISLCVASQVGEEKCSGGGVRNVRCEEKIRTLAIMHLAQIHGCQTFDQSTMRWRIGLGRHIDDD